MKTKNIRWRLNKALEARRRTGELGERDLFSIAEPPR
jgi:hypothetical protein